MGLSDRQAELADHALAVLGERGMPGVTYRAVAAAAGCSVGAVQKAFSTRDEMVRAMFIRLREQAGAQPAGEPGRPVLVDWLTDLLLGMLPLDERTRALSLQSAAFGDLAVREPGVAGAIRASDAQIIADVGRLVARGQREGEVASAANPEWVAWAYLALAQGLTMQLSYGPAPGDLRERVRSAVAALLG